MKSGKAEKGKRLAPAGSTVALLKQFARAYHAGQDLPNGLYGFIVN